MSLETAKEDVKKFATQVLNWFETHFGISNYIETEHQADLKPVEASKSETDPTIAKTKENSSQTP